MPFVRFFVALVALVAALLKGVFFCAIPLAITGALVLWAVVVAVGFALLVGWHALWVVPLVGLCVYALGAAALALGGSTPAPRLTASRSEAGAKRA